MQQEDDPKHTSKSTVDGLRNIRTLSVHTVLLGKMFSGLFGLKPSNITLFLEILKHQIYINLHCRVYL